MKWFKFYSQDYLTDPKMLSLTIAEKAIWLTILCLANNEEAPGVIKYIDESKILTLSGITPLDDEWNENDNVLKRFQELSMIQVVDETITLCNFIKRQDGNLTSYERVKKHREKKKNEKIEAKNDNETNVINDNARIDKIREDKKRKEKINILADKPQAIPPEEKKVKTYERKPPEKQTQLQRIGYYLEDTLKTTIVTWGKQAKALDMMLKAGYTEKQILYAIEDMSLDEFYQDKGFDLTTVANNIARIKARVERQRKANDG